MDENLEQLNDLKEVVEKLQDKKIEMNEDTKKVIDEHKVDENEVLELDEWDLDFEEKFPLQHVANLSGKKVYARRMTLKDKSNFVQAMKKLKNDIEFTAYAIAELAFDEEGNKIFKTEMQKQAILNRKPEEILSLYLKLYQASEPDEYLKYIQNNK